jgi:dienelactone hydrolase
MSEQREVTQDFDGQTLTHLLVHEGSGSARPAVIIFPTVMGVAPLETGFAEQLCELGYSALVADLYGRRFTPDERPAAKAAMDALRADRAGLRDRLLAVLGAAQELDQVDDERVAAIGYCFGGQCALDLARSGADIAGVASFHGLFDPPGLPPQTIAAKVVAFHGWDDPLAPPESVTALAKELTEAGADWQIHAYGHTRHGFTNPNAAAAGSDAVRFNEVAARRSWASLEAYLAELFE